VVAKRGSILFEKDIHNKADSVIDYDLVADPDCLYVEANMKEVTSILGAHISDLLGKVSLIEALQKISIFKNFTQKKLQILSKKIQTQKFQEGDKVIIEGEDGSKFYIIKKGSVDIFVKGDYIRTLAENQYFGERALFFKENRSATAVAKGSIEVYFLDKESFKSIIDENMKEFLINRLYLQDNTIKVEDLEYLQQLGAGSYGSVYLVRAKKNNFNYAIKCIAKRQIDEEALHKNLELERGILLKIDHPFIVKLVKTLKDSKHIFFLMEYIKGKELFDIIREIGLLNAYQTQFYGASMMLAVEYLHERKFIFRDLKPENIIVLNNVGIKLTL
jgi:cGMP-dependent protein kinase